MEANVSNANINGSQNVIESKVNIKINENAEDKDFTFIVPHACPYDLAKRGALSMYEYIVRLELDALQLKQAEEAKKAREDAPATPVEAEVVG